MTTWFPIGLDGRSAINVMDGAYGATGGGSTADTTAISAAIAAMSTLGKKVLVFPSGYTFLTGALTYNIANSHIVFMPGMTFKAAAGLGNDASLLDIQADDVTLHVMGTLNGNRAAQSGATNQRIIHSYQYDRVKVLGYGKSGLVTGSTGHGIWLRDGDDLLIQEMRGTDCGYDPLYIQATTVAIRRPRIERCFVDRSAEAGTANDTGCIKIQATGTGGKCYDPVIQDCDSIHCDGGTNVANELWALDAGGIIGGGLINNATEGPAAGIGQSIAKAVQSKLQPRRAIGATLCLELADCVESEMAGGVADCENIASSTCATLDNSGTDGYGNRLHHVTAKNAAATGISVVGNNYEPVIDGNTIRMSVASASAEAILNDGGIDAVISHNTIRLTGASTRAIVTDTAGQIVEGNNIVVNTGDGIVHSNGNHTVMRGNKLKATGTGGAAYALTDCQYCEAVYGSIEGTWTNGCNLVSSAGTLDHNIVGGWTGDGGSASINTVNNGGTWGTHNRSLPIDGWLPGGGEYAGFSRLAASFSNWVWDNGILTGAVPTTGPLFGGNGSMITVLDHGTTDNNVPWVLKSGTWTVVV